MIATKVFSLYYSMESPAMSDSGMSDQFHDCNSQPSSPRPKVSPAENGDEQQVDGSSGDPSPVGSREPTPAMSGMIQTFNSIGSHIFY